MVSKLSAVATLGADTRTPATRAPQMPARRQTKVIGQSSLYVRQRDPSRQAARTAWPAARPFLVRRLEGGGQRLQERMACCHPQNAATFARRQSLPGG